MKRPRELPYFGTTVSIKDTIAKIEALLEKYNLVGNQITKYGNIFRIVFALRKDNKEYAFQFEISIPEDAKFARQKFRAFYWHLKSRLEAVDFGLFTLQEVFMAELIISLPNGERTTVKNALINNPNKLLPVGDDYFRGSN